MDNSSYQPIVLHLDDNHDVIQVAVEDVVRPIAVHLGPFLSWEQVTDKPNDFPPTPHQHTVAETEGLAEALAGKPDEAPDDGKQYARRNRTWAEVDGLPDQTGHQGKALVTDGTRASWQEQTGGSGGSSGDVEEAPQDGQLYFRHNGAWTAVSDTFLETTPVGLTALWDGSAIAPAGWLECDGAEIDSTQYPELYELYKDRIEIGKAFLPDYRGEFIRGWDHGRGVDTDRELGSGQADEMANHAHEVAIAINESKWDAMPFGTSADPAVIRGQYHDLGTGDTAEGTERWMLSNTRGGDETRPRNRAAMVIIKGIAGPNLVSQLAVPQRSVYSGIAGQQTFSHHYEINRPVSVFVDGLKLIKGTHFTAESGTDIYLNTPLSVDADVEIESLGKLTLYESSSRNLQTQIDSLSDDVSQMQTQLATQESGLTQVQSQVATQANDLAQMQLDVSNQGNDVVQLQTDIATITSGLSQSQADIASVNSDLSQAQSDITKATSDLSQVESDVSDLQSNMNTNFSDLVPRVEALESRVIPPDLSAAIADLAARVEALENSTPTEPPADEDDDMKLLGTFEHTNSDDISITDGFDDSLYSGYHLVISNLAIEDSDYRQKKLGIAFWNGSAWQDGFGMATTSVIKTGGADGSMEGSYTGYVLAEAEMDSVYLSGTLSISMSGSSKGAWTANFNSGNGNPYLSAMLSAPVFESIQGVRFFTDAQTNNVISGTFSIYGLKK
ncbi:tail fiber protein [Endozoicomonas sp. SCSIO W0465]|uniref:tail fiber protein n=1 Tax=Endozoicomonas sp. SCSIO W0465 TaxID=2918516 RepID=UPI002076303D|nr:tail fiber protein [Endozoicomonas sp. SCSIO W0465]USE36379.1 tail fiber protein [Endozoicomonas sp. SCSIO W0465]